MLTRLDLFYLGQEHITKWCALNNVEPPTISDDQKSDDFETCAYYRDGVIHISVNNCAKIGTSGRAWSFPGHITDRTPYGVLAHELGHHVEVAHGARGGIVAASWRAETKEKPLTNYCPNDNEWFAELFRLFVTNPDLLSRVRKKIYPKFLERWPNLAETRRWEEVITLDRQRKSAANHIFNRLPAHQRRQAILDLG